MAPSGCADYCGFDQHHFHCADLGDSFALPGLWIKSAPAAGSVDKNVAGKQSITDVYLPVSLTYYENDTRYQLSSTKIDVIDLARRRVKTSESKKLPKKRSEVKKSTSNF